MLHTSPSGEERRVTKTKHGCVADYNLGQNKMEQQTPIPPKKIKDEAARRTKTRHFRILDLGGGGGGRSRFSIYFVQDCTSMQDRSLPVPLRYKVSSASDLSLINMPCHFLCVGKQLTNPLDIVFLD